MKDDAFDIRRNLIHHEKGAITLAKKKSKTDKVEFHPAKDAVDVRKFINPAFMNMSEKELDKMQSEIRELEIDAAANLHATAPRINDAYLRDDVVHPVEGGESHED